MYVAEHYLGMTGRNRPVHKDELKKTFARNGSLLVQQLVISQLRSTRYSRRYHNNVKPAGMDDMWAYHLKLYDTPLLGIQHGEIEAP